MRRSWATNVYICYSSRVCRRYIAWIMYPHALPVERKCWKTDWESNLLGMNMCTPLLHRGVDINKHLP